MLSQIKGMLILLFAVLVLYSASAKSVTVIYNFPAGQGTDVSQAVALIDDANAFSAFVNVANSNGINLDLVYNETFGWYINSINSIASSATEYWLFWTNYTALAPVGISAYVPADGEIIEMAYSDWPGDTALTVNVKDSGNNAIENAQIYLNGILIGNTNAQGTLSKSLTLKKDTYEIKAKKDTSEKTASITVVDYSAITANLVLEDSTARALNWLLTHQDSSGQIGTHAVWGNAFALMALSLFSGNDTVKTNAMNYLLANQGDDAGFGYPGFGSDVLHTAVSAMALISNGKQLQEFAKNGKTSTEYMLSNQISDGGFGYGASDVDTTSWSAVAFAQSGQQQPTVNSKTPKDFLLSAQNSDGGFPYNAGGASSVEYSAEALIGLKAANYAKDSKITNAINYLRAGQSANGCFSNAYTTSLSAIALIAYGEDANSAIACLKTLQLSDGGFARSGSTGNSVDTAAAIIAISEKTFPLSTSSTSSDSNGVAPLNSVVKFVVPITNTGKHKATDVYAQIPGINANWILEGSSTRSFSEINPNETKNAVIYVKMQSVGEINIRAEITANELVGAASTNYVKVLVEAITLLASMYVDSITQG